MSLFTVKNKALKDLISQSNVSIGDVKEEKQLNDVLAGKNVVSSSGLTSASGVYKPPTVTQQRDAQIAALREKNEATRAAMSQAQTAASSATPTLNTTQIPKQNIKPEVFVEQKIDTPRVRADRQIITPTRKESVSDEISPLRKQIADTYTMSPEEVSLSEQLNNVLSSEELGLNQIERKPIATRFITGQQAALQRQAATQATPLQRQLALLQAQREGTRGMLSQELDYLGREEDSLRTTLSDIAKTAIESGATQEQVNNILSSGSAENALSYMAGITGTRVGTGGGYGSEIFALAEQVKRGDIDLSTVPSELRGQVAAAMQEVDITGDIAGENTAVREADVVINNIDDAINIIDEGSSGINTAGNALMRQIFGGSSAFSRILGAGGEAQTLRVLLNPIQGAIAFDRLQQMREESKTGGALGPVSDREIGLLSSIAGSLDTVQDTETLKRTLNEIKTRFERIKAVESPATSPAEYSALFPDATNEELEQVVSRYNDFMSQQSFNSVDGDTQIAGIANAIAQVESGGSYSAVGPMTENGNRAYGKYQVMDFNIPTWTQEFFGQSLTPEQFLANPQAQDVVALGKMKSIFEQYGTPGDVASVWFSGRPLSRSGNSADITGTTVPEYVQKVIANLS